MTLRHRRLDSNHDFVFGQGRNDYIADVDAVAQAVETRLKLLKGEWWEDIADGLPLFQLILGNRSTDTKTKDLIIQGRILGTTGVINIESYSSLQDDNTGEYQFVCTINTEYGAVSLSNVAGGL